MPRNTDLIEKRNEYLRERWRYHRYKNPKWTVIAVIEEVAKDVWLEPTTVAKILKTDGSKVPCVDTVKKYTQLSMLY